MKIRIDITDLKKAVADMEPLLKGNAVELLNSLLITAQGDTIRLMVNNLGLQVEKELPGEIMEEGKALLHQQDLSLLLRMKGDVEMEFAGRQCTVRGSRIFMFSIDEKTDDFPFMPVISEDTANFTIPECELHYCLKMKKLISKAEERAQLRGLWIDRNNILACDGHRLGKIETGSHAAQRFMLPDFLLDFLAKALDAKSSAPLSFFLAERGYVKACADGFTATFRQYDGDFLSYEKLFDMSGARDIVMQKQALAEAIGFVCSVSRSSDKKRGSQRDPVVYRFDGGKLTLVFRQQQKQVEQDIPLAGPDAGTMGLNIGFDPFYNYEMLSLVDGEKVTMRFQNPISPATLQGDKRNETYMLLPVKMREAA